MTTNPDIEPFIDMLAAGLVLPEDRFRRLVRAVVGDFAGQVADNAAAAERERVAAAIDTAGDQDGIYGDWYGGMGEAAEIARQLPPHDDAKEH